MFHSKRILISVVVTAFLTSCASPRFQTAYRYEPPTDMAGRIALEKCEQKLESCQQRCTAETQACLKSIEPLVEQRNAEALKHYETELEQYRIARQRYELAMSLNWGYDPFWYDPMFYRPRLRPYYYPPAPPKKPGRDEVFNQVRHEKCGIDCGCQPLYDACFLASGGKKMPEERCIANCPKEK